MLSNSNPSHNGSHSTQRKRPSSDWNGSIVPVSLLAPSQQQGYTTSDRDVKSPWISTRRRPRPEPRQWCGLPRRLLSIQQEGKSSWQDRLWRLWPKQGMLTATIEGSVSRFEQKMAASLEEEGCFECVLCWRETATSAENRRKVGH